MNGQVIEKWPFSEVGPKVAERVPLYINNLQQFFVHFFAKFDILVTDQLKVTLTVTLTLILLIPYSNRATRDSAADNSGDYQSMIRRHVPP